MSFTYETIQAWHEAGETTAQIRDRLLADTRHKKDIKATGGDAAKGDPDLLHVLSAKMGLLFIDENAGWAGDLVDYMTSLPEKDQLRTGFRKLLSVLQLTGRQVYCHSDPATGYLTTAITQVCQTLADADVNNPYDAAAVQAEMDLLTGGRMYEGVTEADVQAAIDAKAEQDRQDDIEALRAEIENDFINPSMADGVTTAAQLRTMIQESL